MVRQRGLRARVAGRGRRRTNARTALLQQLLPVRPPAVDRAGAVGEARDDLELEVGDRGRLDGRGVGGVEHDAQRITVIDGQDREDPLVRRCGRQPADFCQ